MTRPLSVRTVALYEPPDYPGVPVCRDFARRRYAPTVLDAIKNGLSRPLVVFGLFTCLSLPVSGDDKKKDGPAIQGESDPKGGDKDAKPEIRMLSRDEVEKLVCGLDQIRQETGPQVRGEVASLSGFLTEEEGRSLLAAFFEKNGFAIRNDVPLRDRQVDFVVDGFDASRQVGFEFIGPQDPGAWEFVPAENDLSETEARELDLAKARGGRAILVLDGRRYRYDISYSGLPSKGEIVDRLQEDLRSFFVWLADQGRLAPLASGGKEEKE
ncbi:MAG: hypothetical protein HY720_33255 [Planctomycetes bacterium]|nr:hypothetical protein [Planctomycetota bacterium]